jgi:hypothetical protein
VTKEDEPITQNGIEGVVPIISVAADAVWTRIAR